MRTLLSEAEDAGLFFVCEQKMVLDLVYQGRIKKDEQRIEESKSK